MIKALLGLCLVLTLFGSIGTTKTYGIIGCRVAYGHNVVFVYPGGPADKAGLQVGDKIVSYMDAEGKDIDADGAPGVDVYLLIRRNGVEDRVVKVTRVPYQSLNNEHLNKTFEGAAKDYETP